MDKQKLIMFLLLDAVNDDKRVLYELRYDLAMPYAIDASMIKFSDVSNALSALCAQGYVTLELVTEPAWQIVEEVEQDKVGGLLDNPDNWTILENNLAYTVSTKDESKTIQLENALYDELRSQGLELKVPN